MLNSPQQSFVSQVAFELDELWKRFEVCNQLLSVILFNNSEQRIHFVQYFSQTFLALTPAERASKISEAMRSREFCKALENYRMRDFSLESFVATLHSNIEQMSRLKMMMQSKRNQSFLQECIVEFDTLTEYSHAHELLFDELLGFTSVGEIENSVVTLTRQKTWAGSAEGRYAYASSLRRIKRFYDAVAPKAEDVVYDLGSGYGHALFYGAAKYKATQFKGIEYVTDRVCRSLETQSQFEFCNIQFVAGDVRDHDFSDGTIFYLYSPFSMDIKLEVFARIAELGRMKNLQIYIYDLDGLDYFENKDLFCKVHDCNGEKLFKSSP